MGVCPSGQFYHRYSLHTFSLVSIFWLIIIIHVANGSQVVDYFRNFHHLESESDCLTPSSSFHWLTRMVGTVVWVPKMWSRARSRQNPFVSSDVEITPRVYTVHPLTQPHNHNNPPCLWHMWCNNQRWTKWLQYHSQNKNQLWSNNLISPLPWPPPMTRYHYQ